jgi:hypothetical protein
VRSRITCHPTYAARARSTELGSSCAARRGVDFITTTPRSASTVRQRIYFHQVETRMGRYPP